MTNDENMITLDLGDLVYLVESKLWLLVINIKNDKYVDFLKVSNGDIRLWDGMCRKISLCHYVIVYKLFKNDE